MQFSRIFSATLLAGATSLAAAQPAAAMPLMASPAPRTASAGFQTVQYRYWDGGWHRRHRWHHGYYGDRYYGDGAAALGGLAAGAIIGGAIANSQARADANAYCSQRFKSYDPASGTYLGYDGVRHPCP
jgi:hypothetical protein